MLTTSKSESAAKWLLFAEDWQLPPLSHPSQNQPCQAALAAYSETMAALIDVQQEVSTRFMKSRHLKPCSQFLAHQKLISQPITPGTIHTLPASDGLDYLYSPHECLCVQGSFNGIWTLDSASARNAERVHLGTKLVLYKLDQFKTLFPHAAFFWVFLTGLTAAHFLWQHYSALPAKHITTQPQLLSYKTQFDPIAVESTFRSIGLAALSYGVSSLSLGDCDAFTLGIYAGESLLMCTELGVVKVAQETTLVDIVLH